MNTKRIWRTIAVFLTVALLMIPIVAVQAAPGGNPGPPPGKGGEETATNNLSVPAIFVPDASDFSSLSCPQTPVLPPVGGDPLTDFDLPGYYYVQGVHTWQAECETAAVNTVTAVVEWGDNLTGAPLKANTPIRVEVGLVDDTASMVGYVVEKLEPSLLDREAAYGTEATLTGGVWSANPVTFTSGVRVYDADATFSIQNEVTGEYVVGPIAMGAEINSTGRIVYGYNWGIGGHGAKDLPQEGSYIITFTAPNVTLSNADEESDTVTLHLIVEPKEKPGKGPKPKDQLQLQDQDRDRLHQ